MSGEALKGQSSTAFCSGVIDGISDQIKSLARHVQLGIVVGGGNVFRGQEHCSRSLTRSDADHIGMIATIINGLTLKNALLSRGIPAKVFSAIAGFGIDAFHTKDAITFMESGGVVICVGGTGNPYFTTDTAAVLRSLELKCSLLLKATKVDGVYDEDPHQNPKAKRFDKLSYDDVMNKGLKVMDATAISLASEHKLPILVFSLSEPNCFEKVLNNKITHTIIS